ncbi:MAG: trehalase family glycosidase [Bacteroidota bacterium]
MNLTADCKRILTQNWRDGYTVPSPKLYPFQWNWDSGFIALGYLHYDVERAFQEMESLFQGQWANGFLPHIVFHQAEKYQDGYFPSANYWNSGVSPHAPKLKTTGITQPPIHGYILERLYEADGPSDRLGKLFDQVLAYHEHLYATRDIHQNGLLAIWHNWESGMDNSPWWDEALGRIPDSELANIALDRRDNKVVANSAETRPTDDEYRRYLWLLQTLQGQQFGNAPSGFPFQLADLTVNSLLLASTESLIRLGPSLGRTMEAWEARLAQGKASFNALLWSEEKGYYFPYDWVGETQVPYIGAACFLPLFGGIPRQAQADRLVSHLADYDQMYGVPSFDPRQPQYEPKKYWRGPIWVNMNYMIWKGLLRYGKTAEADSLKSRTLEMVERYGLVEYYPADTQEATGYGAEDFSWSASLVLDMLNS